MNRRATPPPKDLAPDMDRLAVILEGASIGWFVDGAERVAAERLLDVLESLVEGAQRQRTHPLASDHDNGAGPCQ